LTQRRPSTATANQTRLRAFGAAISYRELSEWCERRLFSQRELSIRNGGGRSRPDRWRGTAGPNLGQWWPARLVATEAETRSGRLIAHIAKYEAPAQPRGFCFRKSVIGPKRKSSDVRFRAAVRSIADIKRALIRAALTVLVFRVRSPIFVRLPIFEDHPA
jgi:hypothetical protein